MPFNINPQNSATEYVPGEIETRVLSQDRTVTANTTLVTVPELSFSLARFQRVLFRFNLFYSSPAAADFKYRLRVVDTAVAPVTLTQYRAFRETWVPDATALAFALDTSNNGTTDIAPVHAANTDGFIRGTGIIHNGATAGEFQVLFAQNTSDPGNTILRAGSFIDLEYI
jgi:hypothetical protein